MKKLLIFFVTILLFTGCGEKTYKEISYEKLNDMIEKEESFVLFIGSETCSHCMLYKDKVKRIIKEYKIDIYYLDIDKMSDSEISKFKVFINYSGTPTTVFIKNGKELKDENENAIYRVNGNKDYDEVVSKFKKAGFIKE